VFRWRFSNGTDDAGRDYSSAKRNYILPGDGDREYKDQKLRKLKKR